MNAVYIPKVCHRMIQAIREGKNFTRDNVTVKVEPYGFTVYLYGFLLSIIDTSKKEIYLEVSKANLTTFKYLYVLVDYFKLDVELNIDKQGITFTLNGHTYFNSIKVSYEL